MTAELDITNLLNSAAQWRDADPDPATREVLSSLIERATSDPAAMTELFDCFAGTLGFGTAGLRGALGPGPNRMNRVVVMRAASALGAFLREVEETTAAGLVVVGYDARHNSAQFAHDTCAVLTGVGIPVAAFPHHCPTPMLAFAVQHLAAAAGVMVTASHNPARDNGYKVYLGPGSGLDYTGSQIVSPVDLRIAELMQTVGSVADLALGDDWVTLDDEIAHAYVTRAARTVSGSAERSLRVVHTAMHGVGAEPFRAAAALAGFTDIADVAQQALPNPDFPTVAFPNPEEPGALDLAFAHAAALNVDVIIAHDPDADRCAVALPVRVEHVTHADSGVEHKAHSAQASGITSTQGWERLSGDDVGLLLGWWRLEQNRLATKPLPSGAVFGSSIVSGSLLQRLCTRRGVPHVRTLTGFKWLARIPNFAYGYEEALGYCVDPEAVHDKDGISAALVLMECLAHLKSERRTAHDIINELRDELGGGATHNISVNISTATAASGIMQTLLHHPPSHVAGCTVIGADDMNEGIDGLPPTSGVRWRLSDNSETPWRIIIRPSGTEPKIKCYVEVATAAQAESVAKACTTIISAAER